MIKLKKISIDYIYYFLIVFPFFEPGILTIFSSLSSIHRIFNMLRLIVCICAVILTIVKRKISNNTIKIIALYIIYMISTIIENASISNLSRDMCYIIGICMITDMAFFEKKEIYFLSSIVALLEILLVINSVSVFLFYQQGGLVTDIETIRMKSNNYFLGYDNQHIYFILPYLSLSLINDKLKFNKIKTKTIIIHILQIITVFICWSADTVVSVFVFYIFLFFRKKKLFRNFLNRKTTIFVVVVLSYLLVVIGSTNFMNNLFMTVLQKNIEGVRSRIWTNYLNAALNKWFLGNGYVSIDNRYALLFASHAHNMYLDVFYISGIVGLFVFLYIIYCSLDNNYENNYINVILIISIFSYSVAFLATARTYCPTFFLLLMISYWFTRLKARENNCVND